MKITVLAENTANQANLTCEHGLSLYIEYCGLHFLLDAGSSSAFLDNARRMNVAVEQADYCILSHGHYDHAGGLGTLFSYSPKLRVFAQKSAEERFFSASGGLHEIGIPEKVLLMRDRFCFVQGNASLCPGVRLISHHTPQLDRIGEKTGLFRLHNGRMCPDDFSHEQSLVFLTEKGLVIFNSCSHGGLKNIVCEAREAFEGAPVYAYIGGLHMKGKHCGKEICTFSNQELDELCGFIRKEHIALIYTGHCTGEVGYRNLKERLGDQLQPLKTGNVIVLPC